MSVLPFSCVFICTISPLYSFFLSPSSFYSALNLVLLWFKVLLPSELLTCLYSNILNVLILLCSCAYLSFMPYLSHIFLSFSSFFLLLFFWLHLFSSTSTLWYLLEPYYMRHITYYLTNRRFISIIFLYNIYNIFLRLKGSSTLSWNIYFISFNNNIRSGTYR